MVLAWPKVITLGPLFFALSKADITIYTDGSLAAGWENWSWSSDINFAATDLYEGTSSISVNSSQYAALSLYYEELFSDYAGLQFDVAGAQPDLTISIQSNSDGDSSPSISLSAISQAVTASNFTTLLINFSDLPGYGTQLGNDSWDRIDFQAGSNGAYYHIDNIVLLSTITIAPQFLSAEPIANNIIAITTTGDVDFSTVQVTLNGAAIKIANETTYVPPDTPSKSITYLTLASSFASGPLVITAGDVTFNWTLPDVQYGSIVQDVNYPIDPHVYGMNFPTDANYIKDLGITISRWGGNAVTAYNPFGGFTNAGSDWYFENRASDSADDWVGWVAGAGSDTLLTIPALDWVSKDATSYSYSAQTYPDQEAFDSSNPDAGDGLFPNGSAVSPPTDPHIAYVPWNVSAAQQWLSGLANKPTIVTIDNEMEIASSTHQDMHPDPMGYDEQLARVLNFSTMAKAALPDVLVAAPSTDSWWYYWTSAIGWSDTEAHDNIDFIPWFLMQMKQQEDQTGKRLLDYLDIHYYFQDDTSANDAAAKALRLRSTRSFWDTSYVDESWISEDPQNHQWNPAVVELIPRMKTLIDQNYPGTKFSISEWSSSADDDITGGLVAADVLGILGRYQVDSATYWEDPSEQSPAGLAFWLYRGFGTFFGSSSAQVNLANPNPDLLGVYAGTEDGNTLSLVIVNKDPVNVIAFDLANVPTGTYLLRHFGGEAGAAQWQSTIDLGSSDYIVVAPYTAIFLLQQ